MLSTACGGVTGCATACSKGTRPVVGDLWVENPNPRISPGAAVNILKEDATSAGLEKLN
jgi:hypothetical protein